MDTVTAHGLSGLTIMLIVVMAILIVFMALALYRKSHPDSALSRDVQAAEDKLGSVVSHAEDDLRKAGTWFRADAEPAMTRTVLAAEMGVDKGLTDLLDAVQTKLKDTSSEDAAIVAARAYLARVTAEVEEKIKTAEAAKQAKADALAQHVATLTGTGS